MTLGKVIRKYRKGKSMTQEEMAARLGVSAPAVNKWENENSYPDIMLLAPIARLLEISLDFDVTLANLYTYRKRRGNPTAKTIDKIIAGVEENCPELLPERQKKPQPSADR